MANKKIKNATVTEYKGITFRSKLEAETAKLFDLLQIEYEYEKFRIDLIPSFKYNGETIRKMSYLPDFRVNNAIIECKGFASDGWKVRKKIILYKLAKEKKYDYFEIHSKKDVFDMIENDPRFITFNVQVYDLKNSFIKEYDTVSDAIKDLNLKKIKASNIYECMLGRRNYAYGYIWKKVERSFIPDKGEIWKEIPSFKGLYYASNKGRIASAQFHGVNNFRLLSFHNVKGYWHVKLRDWKNKINRDFSVHRLVAEAFIPNPENKQFIDHIDTNRSNNNVNNLRWCTQSENNHNPLTLKRISKNITDYNKSEKHTEDMKRNFGKNVIIKNITTNEIIEFQSFGDAAKHFNTSPMAIKVVCDRKNHIYKKIWEINYK